MNRVVIANIIVPLVSAIIGAIVGSGVTTYYQFYKPGNVDLTVASPLIKPLGKTQGPLSFLLALTLTNTGGKAQCLWDLALRVKALNSDTKWSYFPAVIVNYKQYLAQLGQPNPSESALESVFTPYVIGGRSVIAQSIVFLPRSPSAVPTPPFTAESLVPGERYTLTLYTKIAAEECNVPSSEANYEPKMAIEVKLAPNQIDALKAGTGIVLLDQSRDDSREHFIRQQ